MTDSIRCTAESPNKFSCEVEIDSHIAAPEPASTPAPPTAPAVAASPPPSNPAVSKLVSTFVSKTVVPAPAPPLITGSALLKCASSEMSIVLAAATAKTPILVGLGMLKAALDAGTCLTAAYDQAAQRNAENYCLAQGGIVTGVEGDKTICEVREHAK